MDPVTLSSGIAVRRYERSDAAGLLAVVDRERERLARWMPWVPYSTTVGSFEAFIDEALRQEDQGTAVHRVLLRGEHIVGGFGATIGVVNGDEADVGYWIASTEEGKGIVSEVVTELLRWLFEVAEMHRVTIRAATGNTRSRAVAERLGFTYEGVLRSSLRLGDRHEDAALYSMLEDEWRARG